MLGHPLEHTELPVIRVVRQYLDASGNERSERPAFFAVPDSGTPGEIAVQIIDLTDYQSWQTTHFTSTTSPESQPSVDPDNDGMTNLEEFQAGTDPKLATSFIPLVWQGGGSNSWDLATTANWLENATPRVFRDNRHISITDSGSNSRAVHRLILGTNDFTGNISSNLSTWTSVNLTSTIGPEVTLGKVSNGSRSVTVTLPRPTPNENFFGRVKVTQP